MRSVRYVDNLARSHSGPCLRITEQRVKVVVTKWLTGQVSWTPVSVRKYRFKTESNYISALDNLHFFKASARTLGYGQKLMSTFCDADSKFSSSLLAICHFDSADALKIDLSKSRAYTARFCQHDVLKNDQSAQIGSRDYCRSGASVVGDAGQRLPAFDLFDLFAYPEQSQK